jgi:NTP pyrophosphatase (non-canonical NTP hydrolase)
MRKKMNNQINEILSISQEECAEVIQAISKIFRFGIDTSWNGEKNREHLEEELGDLVAMIFLMTKNGIVDEAKICKAADKKLLKLAKWSNITFTNDK